MDINKLDSIGQSDSQAAQQRAAQTAAAKKRQEHAHVQTPQPADDASSTRGSDTANTVQLSDAARALSTKTQDAQDDAGIDHQHLESIRQAIAEGRYHVDGQRLAEQILRLENEIYGS